MDDDTYAYDGTKQALYDGRVKSPKHDKALRELCSLEFNSKKLKIDHPPAGSKDVCDAMAGVIWGLTMRREIWTRHEVSLVHMPASLANLANRHSIAEKERQAAETLQAIADIPYIDRVRVSRGVAPRDLEGKE